MYGSLLWCPWILSVALDVSFFGMKIDTVKEGLALGREANHQVLKSVLKVL